MKTVHRSFLKRSAFVFVALILSQATASKAALLEGELTYPVAIGVMGQNFNSNLGFGAAIFIDPILDPRINNFLSVGYESFTLKADKKTSLRLIPILVGIELPGKIFDDLHSTFGLAGGGTVAYLNVTNAQTINMNGYFTVQVKPGLTYDASQSFNIYMRMPVTFVIGSSSMSNIAYTAGVGIKL